MRGKVWRGVLCPLAVLFAVVLSVVLGSSQTLPMRVPAGAQGEGSAALLRRVHAEFAGLERQTIRPAAGVIPHDYLIPAGYYRQMWDWDGFFIGMHFAHQSAAQAVYLKWWVLNFAQAVDADGYVSGQLSGLCGAAAIWV